MVGKATRRGFGLAAAGALVYAGRRALVRSRELELAGKVVLITGGSRGLGLLLAREFGRRRCRVAICARDLRELAVARDDLEARGIDVLAVACDVADRDQVERMVRTVTEQLGRIDVLVNNAGIIQVGPVELMELEDFRQAMDVNFWGAVHTTLAVLPGMRDRRSGRITNITSIGGRVAIPHLLPYVASKFAMRGFSEGLRAELAKHGVVVTTIVPGLMRTGSPVNALFKGRRAREFTWFSLGDSLPVSSMSAERAARRIVEATRRGEAEVTLSWQARALGLVHDLFPGATTNLLSLVNRVLPDAKGDARANVRGMQLAAPLSPSPLTALMNRAARTYNQFGGGHEAAPEHAKRIGIA